MLCVIANAKIAKNIMYSFEKKYYDDENLRFIDANESINENDEYIVLFQREFLKNFIDCYCKFYFSYNKKYDDENVKTMCDMFDKQIVIDEFENIMSKYNDLKIINCMYFDYLNTGDYALFFVMYEKQIIDDDNIFVDIYEINYDYDDDEFCFEINDYVTYLFMNEFNAMKCLLNYCCDDCERITIKSSNSYNFSMYICKHNEYVLKFDNV